WPSPRSMRSDQAARWKNVAPFASSTNASQRRVSSRVKRLTAQALAGWFSLTWSSMPHPLSLRADSGIRECHDRILRIGGNRKHAIHPVEPEVTQQPSHTWRHALQVQIVARAVPQRDARHPRLAGIDLPGVEIENGRTPLLAIDTLEPTTEQRIGQQPEKSAAAARPVASPQSHRRGRHFQQSGRARDERKPRCLRHPVQVVPDRNDAGTVLIACFAKFLVRPQGGGTDGPTRRTIAVHRRAADVFQQLLGTNDAFAELSAIDLREPLVPESMTRNLVTRGGDVAHQRGAAFGDPPEREEGCVDAAALEKLEDAPGVGFDPHGPALPIFASNAVFERRDLEIILDIHRHGVGDLPGLGRRRVHLWRSPRRLPRSGSVTKSSFTVPKCSSSGCTAAGSTGVGGEPPSRICLRRCSSRISCNRILLRWCSSVANSLSCSAGEAAWAAATPRSGTVGSSVCGTSGISSANSLSTVVSAAWSRACRSSR